MVKQWRRSEFYILPWFFSGLIIFPLAQKKILQMHLKINVFVIINTNKAEK